MITGYCVHVVIKPEDFVICENYDFDAPFIDKSAKKYTILKSLIDTETFKNQTIEYGFKDGYYRVIFLKDQLVFLKPE